MLKYAFLAVFDMAFTVCAMLLAPFLPLFARDNWLPTWLSWFQTPDNSLDGDDTNWTSFGKGSYMRHVLWLFRNPAYGFSNAIGITGKISKEAKVSYDGDLAVRNRPQGKEGSLTVTLVQPDGTEYFHWVYVRKVWAGECLYLNFGWKLRSLAEHPDTPADGNTGQFVFSIRLSPFNPA